MLRMMWVSIDVKDQSRPTSQIPTTSTRDDQSGSPRYPVFLYPKHTILALPPGPKGRHLAHSTYKLNQWSDE